MFLFYAEDLRMGMAIADPLILPMDPLPHRLMCTDMVPLREVATDIPPILLTPMDGTMVGVVMAHLAGAVVTMADTEYVNRLE